ncbi:DUF1634 domain-containing protein [Mucilaginibacter xinganensis]|uniref:DUF1634 domain-containing protein n=1 Tax=Mucilaginibacter xinganensis TaxID=1234841 RepID=A0A223P149_9SPHI|nr:DUF1634 domain-containing protein [Mucilaginibacter xinganensis]ASU35863.1 hypothetical protein MuYL_3978 [Mucilaginibacter xinganensis]
MKFKDTDIQSLIGKVLRTGMIISMGIVFFGGILFLYRHGHSIPNYKVFKGIPPFLQNTGSLLHASFQLKGQAIIQLGIILLIATPILRVVFSTLGFVLEKDYLYVGISMVVLAIIFTSMLSGHAG